MNSARDRILNKLSNKSGIEKINQDLNSDNIYSYKHGDLIDIFKEELELVNGEVFIVESDDELSKSINNFINLNNLDNIYSNQKNLELNNNIKLFNSFNIDIDVAITGCEFLSARTGSVVVSSDFDGRKINIFAPTHIVIANKNQLVSDIDKAIEGLQQKYSKLPSSISFITGPSRTADIEKTLILGAHGPKRLIVFIKKY